MKRLIQVIAIVLLSLLFSTVYTYAASDQSPLNTYKHPLLSKLNQMDVLFKDLEEGIKQQEEEKVKQFKEEQEQQSKELLERERTAVIEEIKTHQMTLQKQLEMMDRISSIEAMIMYEEEKTAVIESQMKEEIAAYLSDLLLENSK